MGMLDRKAEKLARAAGVVPPEQVIRSVKWGELVVYRERGRELPLAAYNRATILGYTEDRLFIVGQAKGLAVNLEAIDELQISSPGVVLASLSS
jgi:hypothetical protein